MCVKWGVKSSHLKSPAAEFWKPRWSFFNLYTCASAAVKSEHKSVINKNKRFVIMNVNFVIRLANLQKKTMIQTATQNFSQKNLKKIWWFRKSCLTLQRQKNRDIARWCNWQHVWLWIRRAQVRTLVGQPRIWNEGQFKKELTFSIINLLTRHGNGQKKHTRSWRQHI